MIGCAFNTIAAAALAFKRFSGFLASCQPPVELPEQIDRALLERYLAWLAPQPLAESTKTLSRMFLRALLEENRRHRWLPQLPADAVIYSDELHCRRVSLPRFIPEVVMAQLESETNLEQLRPPYRNLVVLLTETGLGRRCLRATAQLDRARQRRLAVPALCQQQDAHRAPAPVVAASHRRDPSPTALRQPDLAGGDGVAVPVPLRPEPTVALRHLPPGVR